MPERSVANELRRLANHLDESGPIAINAEDWRPQILHAAKRLGSVTAREIWMSRRQEWGNIANARKALELLQSEGLLTKGKRNRFFLVSSDETMPCQKPVQIQIGEAFGHADYFHAS